MDLPDRWQVSLAGAARTDLRELYAHLLERDLDVANRALAAFERAWQVLERNPFICRKAGDGADPHVRELVIAFGSSGYVALFHIDGADTVTVHAIRHQREEDYH